MKTLPLFSLIASACIAIAACGTTTQPANDAEHTPLVPPTLPSQTIQVEQTEDPIQIMTVKMGNDPNDHRLTASYPITPHPELNESARKYTQQLLDEFARKATPRLNDSLAPIDYNQHFDVPLFSQQWAIILYTRSISLGNNYDDYHHAAIFDLEAHREMGIGEFFKDSEAFNLFAEQVKKIAIQAAYERLTTIEPYTTTGERDTLWMQMQETVAKGTLPEPENYDAVYWDQNGDWHIIIDKYQIASGYMGSFHLDIPKEIIAPLLSPRFANFAAQQEHDTPMQQTQPEQQYSILTGSEDSTQTLSPEQAYPLPNGPCIALTFDDGPSMYTDRLLDILKENGVKATFFVLGKSAAIQKQTMRRIANEGHNLGNHSYDHKHFGRISPEEARLQIVRTDSIIQSITQIHPTYFRFPYGAYTPATIALPNRPVMGWSVDPLDWKHRDAQTVAEAMSKAQENAIILAHDIHKTTVDAIPEAIAQLRAKGYRFVTLDELFNGKELKKNTIYHKGE